MALFQASVLKDQLRLQDEQQVDKAYKSFTSFFHNPDIQENIRSSKEEQFQATFLNELFVRVLGYTMNPQPEYNLTTEFKNQKNARKADGAILKDGIAIGVIELKGTNTKHLEGIRQQAFDYKANQKGCVYVITSNFEKLRFYINDATEFVEFDLFELNREDFSLLWFCLHRENLLSGKPLRVKEASLVEEEVITKQFYKDYSVFKRELYRDLVRRNAKRLKNLRASGYESGGQNDELKERHPEPNHRHPDSNQRHPDPDQRHPELVSGSHDPEHKTELAALEKNVKQNLFKKSQKLIDRFLFIFFAEDRALLPPNSIHKILDGWNKLKDLDAEMPLYDRFKLYFGYLDTGRKGTEKKTEIFAYNGGLFKPDPVLDMLEIDDELLYKHTARLATYDFESQVDVNILGHIFENSLNEIESVNAEIEGSDFDKQKSKRKKDGVFYTPKYITKYIVENTVGRLCEEKKSELGFREEEYFRGRKRRQKDTLEGLVKILEDYREWLLQLTICDPACGSGAFLNQALDFLIKEHRYIDEMKAKLLGGKLILSDIENTILERNIYGVDINEESVEIAKLSLWLRTAQPRRKLNDLSDSIKCGNSLIDDKKVAGDKAFKWEEEFPEVFANGGFDVVIGNPPYGIFITEDEEKFYKAHYPLTNYKINLYILFLERMFQVFDKGIVQFIIPKSLLFNTYFQSIRKKLLTDSVIEEVFMISEKVFPDAEVGGSLLIKFDLEKKNIGQNEIKIISTDSFRNYEMQKCLINFVDQEFFLSVPHFEISPIGKGAKTIIQKLNELKKLKEFYNLKNGLNPGNIKGILIDNSKISPQHKPIIWGKEVSKYRIQWGGDFINYDPNIGDTLTLEDVQSKEGMKKQNRIDFALRTPDIFETDKILIRKTGDRFIAALDHENFYFDTLVHGIYQSDEDYPLEYVLAILNSQPATEFYRLLHDIKGKVFAKISLDKLGAFPIPETGREEKQQLGEWSNYLNLITKDQFVLVNQFHKYLCSKFHLEKTSWRLENWHELEFGDFIKELNKVIKISNKEREKEGLKPVPALSKKDEFEWMELFEENKKKALKLQREIEKTDKEIDAMVYKLYGLNEEEIAIVESSAE